MSKIILSFKKHRIIYPLTIIAVIAAIYFIFFSQKKQEFNFETVKRADIVQTVSATGNVKPAKSVNLSFAKTGRISGIFVSVGDRVFTGQQLAILDSSEILPQIAQAQASLENQKAKLEELKIGTRPEQINITETDLAKAKQDLANYYASAVSVINDAFAKADDAVRNQTDVMFTNPQSDFPQLAFTTTNSALESAVINQKIIVKSAMTTWAAELNELNNAPSFENIESILSNSSNSHLPIVGDYLLKLTDAVNSAAGASSATIASYKANLNTARTETNTAASSVSSQKQLINSQKITVQKTENQLALQKAGSTAGEISAQEALVRQAQANLENLQAQYSNTILRSPFDGIITKINPEIGEIASLTSPAISIISDAKFEIEANIPEVDIAKIKIENSTEVTLDAYGNDVVFEAKVVSIDPAETVVEGVPTYKTTLQFTGGEDKIKSGMTANIEIKTAEKKNVLTVPQRAVKITGEKIVTVLNADNETTKEVKVETGLRGSDGNVEIISGLNEGDKVVLP